MIIDRLTLYAVCMLLCYAAYRFRWLTGGGSISAFLMGAVFISAGPATFLLPLVLLTGGTLLAKLNPEEKEHSGRNAAQVLANGFTGTCCLLYFLIRGGSHAGDLDFVAYLIAFSISISDTFSSETGKYFRGRTVDILSLKPAPRGLSGAISLQGSIGGLAGSTLSAILSYLVFDITLAMAGIILFCGFAGMLLDSVFGSAFQAKYKDEKGLVREHASLGYMLSKGFRWCTNDVVNFLSVTAVVVVWLLIRQG